MRKLRTNSLVSIAILSIVLITLAAVAKATVSVEFAQPVPYDAGGTPSSVAVADINGDGHLDLVVAYWNGGGVGVLLGNGDGTFQPVVKYDSGDVHSAALAVADVNGDGKLDIVVLNTYDLPGTVGVLLGNGDGSFQAPATYYTGDYSIPEDLAVGDLNGDGYPDVAVANFGHRDCDCNDGRIGVLWNNGDGTFQPTVFYRSGGYDTVSIVIVNGGAVVTNLCGDRYCDWPNGTVCSGLLEGGCYDTGGEDPYSVAVGDFDRDGYPDISVGNSTSRTVGVLLSTNPYERAAVYDVGAHPNPWSLAVADLNGNGKLDIAVGAGSGTVVLLNDGHGAFQIGGTFGSVGSRLVLADVNEDGKPDAIGTSAVMLNTTRFVTTTQLTSSLNPSFVGQSVTYTATVTSRRGMIPDGELVTFYDKTTVLSSVALVGGTATYTTSSLSAKTHDIKAAYAGDARFASSTRHVKQIVLKYETTTALNSTPNPSNYGEAVTFTATVTSTGPMPTGKVRFLDYGLAFGTSTLSAGVGTLNYSKLLVGKHSITAEYLGDASNAASISPLRYQKVE